MEKNTFEEKKFSMLEFFEISRILEGHHSVFYTMWEMGKPIFSNEVQKASIKYDFAGELISFSINPQFWESLNSYEKSFIIAHECCHILLNHGARKVNVNDEQIASIAMDIVVNEMLLRSFKFNKGELSFSESLCFVDTVFGSESGIPKDEIFEYYFNKIKELIEEINLDMSLADDHSQMQVVSFDKDNENEAGADTQSAGDSNELQDKKVDKIEEGDDSREQVSPFCIDEGMPDWLEEKINTNLSFEEANYINIEISNFQETSNSSNNGLIAGNIAGSFVMTIPDKEIKKKKKWETVIKKWSKKYNKQDFHSVEQWSIKNRRMFCLNSGLILPSEVDQETDLEEKIDVFFFQDTSGSCSGYAKRFFNAAESLPKDKFDIRLFCFDTKTYETDFKTRKLYGFGGTMFDIIEKRIQLEISKGTIKKYPKAVFIITDGYGNVVHPEIPKNWYWFLTPAHSKYCIPKECNVFNLKDYE